MVKCGHHLSVIFFATLCHYVIFFSGALFSATASLETLCNFLGAFIFSSMYPASLKFHFPGFVFLLGTVMLIIPLLFMCRYRLFDMQKSVHIQCRFHVASTPSFALMMIHYGFLNRDGCRSWIAKI